MSLITTISGVSNSIGIKGSALSLIPAGISLITPQQGLPGFAGMVFDCPLTENVTMSAQVTNHYTEDNSFVSDHISFEPVSISLTGKISELVYKKSEGLAFLSAAIQRLQPLGLISPAMGVKAQRAINTVDQFRSAINSAIGTFNNLASIFEEDPIKTKQGKAFKKIEELFNGRTVMTVETPWKTFKNMVIETWSADQTEESIYETTFSVTFKELRFVEIARYNEKLTGRIQQQLAPIANKGVTSKENESAASNLTGLGG